MSFKTYINIAIVIILLFTISCKTKQVSSETKVEISPKEKYISLYKGACYGKCPVYKITINGDGSFIYFGKSNVKFLGTHKGFIPEQEVEPLFNKLATYHWNNYPDEYPIDNVDFPQFNIAYYDGNIKKEIKANSNAAKELIELAKSLDLLSNQLKMEKLN